MSEVIQAIFVPSTETRPLPKPHTEYEVEVYAPVRKWSVWKRYSDFVKLHEHLTTTFAGHPPPMELPAKRIFPPTFSDPNKVDDRRRHLEEYLRAILSNRDDRWRNTEAWKTFLEIPGADNSNRGHPTFTSESWLDEYTDMTNQARDIRSLINRRATHIARNEISASHNCTVQAKKVLLSLGGRISALETGLQQGLLVAEGERRRRQDMVDRLKEEKDALTKLVNLGRLEQHQSLMDPPRNTSESSDKNIPTIRIGPGRAFGTFAAAQQSRETETTRGRDNEGLLQYQQEVMNEQDAQIEQFSDLLARQKQLGLAIGDELDAQNQLLDELDANVDRTALKLKFADKKLGTIQ
ncbi:Phox homologous domain-containing protein [Dichotomocladium elegans]|nr:Phox homologous domain-containing protein [Dichotomocladium elegans]